MSAAPAIGIDLGTTYSCAAVFRNGAVEVIPNELGNRTMPSVVAFTDKRRLVGEAAKDQDYLNPENTIYDAKRLIGRKFDEDSVQADMTNWPFTVVNDSGRPKIRVEFGRETKTFHPEEISSMVLGALKKAASLHLGAEVKDCVVTVPANFGDAQRQSTRDAATIAGLNVLRILNEPTAAALAYGFGEHTEEERNVLIYDLGSSTFDVSILTIEDGIFEVRAACGDPHLGSQDFEFRLCEDLADEFTRKHPGSDIHNDKKAMRRLMTACEKAKRQLSAALDCTVQIDGLHQDIDFATTVTRARFEQLNEDLFKLTLEMLDRALQESALQKPEIDEVVLVGGSTRIPMVQRILSEFFDNRELNTNMNPDEAVARGAALQAAFVDGDLNEKVTNLVLVDVAPLSLGLGVRGSAVIPLVPQGAVLPTRRTKTFTTVVDSQTSVQLQIYEGDRTMTKDCTLIGTLTLRDLPPRPRGEVYIFVTFEVDLDGILQVSAIEHDSGTEGSIRVTNDRYRLSLPELERIIREAEINRAEDEADRDAAQARTRLEHYCFSVKAKVEDKKNKDKIPGAQRQTMLNRCVDTIKWLDGNATANGEVFKNKLKEVEDLCGPRLQTRFPIFAGGNKVEDKKNKDKIPDAQRQTVLNRSVEEIDELLLALESTGIPMVQRILSEFFDNRELNKNLNPGEAVARGAALQAAIVDGDLNEKITDIVLVNVAPLSLGLGVMGSAVAPLVPRGAVLPTRRTKTFKTVVDRQTSVLLKVYEGEHTMTKDCTLLGKFTLRDLPPKPRGELNICVTFEVDSDGILQVSATEHDSGKEGSIRTKLRVTRFKLALDSKMP